MMILVLSFMGFLTILDKIFGDFFYFLVQFSFTTSETKLDYYHQEVNAQVASRVVERLKS